MLRLSLSGQNLHKEGAFLISGTKSLLLFFAFLAPFHISAQSLYKTRFMLRLSLSGQNLHKEGAFLISGTKSLLLFFAFLAPFHISAQSLYKTFPPV